MAVEPVAAPGAEVQRSGVFADFLLIHGYPDLSGSRMLDQLRRRHRRRVDLGQGKCRLDISSVSEK
jgi:hypothetical protein